MARQPGHPADGGKQPDPKVVAELMEEVVAEVEDEGAEAADVEAEAGPGEVAVTADLPAAYPPYSADGVGVVDVNGHRVLIAGYDHNRAVSGPAWAELMAGLLNKHFKHRPA